MGREVGGGFRMGNTDKSMADSRQCMAKTIQYCKVIIIKINGERAAMHPIIIKLKPIILTMVAPASLCGFSLSTSFNHSLFPVSQP